MVDTAKERLCQTKLRTNTYGCNPSSKGNEWRAYFVEVLEEALNLLTPYVTASLTENVLPVRPVPSKIGEARGKPRSNLFDDLEVDKLHDHDVLGAAVIDVHAVVAAGDATRTQWKEVYELESSKVEMQCNILHASRRS